MIIIKLQGGLGNQMFQYAFGLSIAEKLNGPLLFDSSFYRQAAKDLTPRSYELGLFEGVVGIADDRLLDSFFRIGLYQKVLNKLGLNKKTIYKERSLKFNNDVFEVKPPVYFEGFWQSGKYFNGIEDLIRKSLVFKKKLNAGSNEVLGSIMQQQNPVSIHVRRGDYINSKTHEVHGACSVNYYKKAIELIADKISTSHFYFFSDDSEWVKANLLPTVKNGTLVQHNTGSDSWQDMALMSKCRHHIIANSSFSWWGAWLNPNEEKMVIAPQNWFSKKTDYFYDKDIVPESWIRLPND